MINYGASSKLKFLAKLVGSGQSGQQTQAASTQRDAKESLVDAEDDDNSPRGRDSPRGADQLRGPGACLQASSIFSAIEGKRITNSKREIPVEQVQHIVNWLSKKTQVYQMQYQQI